jgi:hypothetical protein
LTTALNSIPIEPSSRAGLTMAVKFEDLLGDRLVLRVEQAVRAGTREALRNQFEIGGDAGVGGIVPGEGLGEIEDDVAVHPRQRVQALDRTIEAVERCLVAKLAERLGDFVLDFSLVKSTREGRLLGRRGGVVFLILPAIVQNYDVQRAHAL